MINRLVTDIQIILYIFFVKIDIKTKLCYNITW